MVIYKANLHLQNERPAGTELRGQNTTGRRGGEAEGAGHTSLFLEEFHQVRDGETKRKRRQEPFLFLHTSIAHAFL